MGMKNLKGGEVCSASGGRFLPDIIYNCTEYKAKLTTNVPIYDYNNRPII